MRLSNLSGKEVINLSDGARLGIIEECELTFDHKSGKILTIVLPKRHGLFNFFNDIKSSTIPWQTIKRIGDEVIIVDINNAYTNFNRERHENTY
ncbi:YlmC/YmxH family sporulation protein [Pelosinus propionicus]|uniref:Sporulation protein, YlmC/YmxH family n=1 Tax=Pelosinus propionicus DSM 13327 TaxID=1123291 RepID=A0A1I4H9X8_9FIRM|nr:YlmC/YmxH family sporulation protein [Pelosinus propionicus]SFL38975.1 sporulation protein, YlmC/YmxH family [Pelosinus propionicus DSM 13327]